jgi:heme-degrading monooxygenase HmoA
MLVPVPSERTTMILREWRARTDAARAGQYPKHFQHDVLPGLASIDGFLGADLCSHEISSGTEYLVLTRWRSLEAVRAFAGADCERSVVDADARTMLTDFDGVVRHYEVIAHAT